MLPLRFFCQVRIMSSKDKKPTEDGGSNAVKLGPPFFVAFALGTVGCYLTFLGPNAGRIRQAVFVPDGKDGESVDNFTFVCACVGLCGLFDVLIARLFGPGRYFALHTAINTACVCFAWRDFVSTLTFANPFESNSCALKGTSCANKFAMDLTMGIHLWHSLAYSLKPIDWVHHIPAHAVCLIGICLAWGPVLNFSIMALMGVPGGIDYGLLTATKLGMLHPSVEKNINQSLNVWLRCPIAVVSAFLMFFGAIVNPDHFTGTGHRVGHALIGVHHFWNGLFFMYRTVDARTRYIIKEKEKKEKASK
jgi:hypothetical protein